MKMISVNIFRIALVGVIMGSLTFCSCQPEPAVNPGNGTEKPEPDDPGHEPQEPVTVTLKGLLDEMTSADLMTRFPSEGYTCRQTSSYDRRSVTPDDPENWFKNDDGWGYERFDRVDGRVEKVIFDEQNPGVVTRMWLTSFGSTKTILRFYFDGSIIPSWTVSSFDLQEFCGDTGVKLGDGLVQPGNVWNRGSVLYLPIPYSQSCKITIEELQDDPVSTSRYYHINFRRYAKDAKVETFKKDVLLAAKSKIKAVNAALLNPAPTADKNIANTLSLESGASAGFDLASGSCAVAQLTVSLLSEAANNAAMLDSIIVRATFDGHSTLELPLSELAGVGVGGYYQKSWRFASDGKGSVSVRWTMPYRTEAKIEYLNLSDSEVEVASTVLLTDYVWDDSSLYFHAAHRKSTNVPIRLWYDFANGYEWPFARIAGGRGVYAGDVYTINNDTDQWPGEGDEKIWVDSESFPSHYGTGVEDYFSFCGYFRFNTPQSGEPRLDAMNFNGINTHYRCRFLDRIPFGSSLRFDLEMQGHAAGKCNLSNTIFWYGDPQTVAENTIKYEF